MADAPTLTETLSGSPLCARYPANLCSPPFDKWIMFSAMSGRHVVRNQVVTENNLPERPLKSVALYLPDAALLSEMAVAYAQDDLGSIEGAAVEFFAQTGTSLMGSGAGQTGYLNNLMKAVKALPGAGIAALGDTKSWTDFFKGDAAKLGGALIGDFAAGVALGVKPNPRTDLLYDTQRYRENNLDFLLVPRTLQEAQDIDTICYFFNYYMLPRYQNSQGENAAKIGAFTIGFPYEFEINMFAAQTDGSNQTLTHINRIGRSVCKAVSINHAGGGKTAFIKDNGEFYPVATKLSLSFQEVRLLGRGDDTINRDGTWNFDNATDDPRR